MNGEQILSCFFWTLLPLGLLLFLPRTFVLSNLPSFSSSWYHFVHFHPHHAFSKVCLFLSRCAGVNDVFITGWRTKDIDERSGRNFLFVFRFTLKKNVGCIRLDVDVGVNLPFYPVSFLSAFLSVLCLPIRCPFALALFLVLRSPYILHLVCYISSQSMGLRVHRA